MSECNISTLAVIKTVYDQNGSILDTYTPFVSDGLAALDRDFVDKAHLQQLIQERSDLYIPQNTIDFLLEQVCEQRGFVTRKDGLWKINKEALLGVDRGRDKQNAGVEFSGLLRALRDYAAGRRLNWGESEAESAMEVFLDQFHLDLLMSIHDGKKWVPPDDAKIIGQTVVVADFVLSLQEKPAEYQQLASLVDAYVISKALDCTPSSGHSVNSII